MKVKCIENTGIALPKELIDDNSGYRNDSKFQLIIEKEYVVYAVTHIKKNVWFFICDEAANGKYGGIYPKYLPAAFFEITDTRLSKYWECAMTKDEYDNNRLILTLGFKELLENEYFIGNLWEDSEPEREIFLRYKAIADKEFT
jgi:hypothetical protein